MYRIRIDWIDRQEDEDEKLLLFDRHGRRYTFIVRKAAERQSDNPSYWTFIERVKKYRPSLRTRLERAKHKRSEG